MGPKSLLRNAGAEQDLANASLPGFPLGRGAAGPSSTRSWRTPAGGGCCMRHRVIHLINPKTDSLTTRPQYLNRALYSPLAGLLAVAGAIPRDRYEVVLT